MTDPRPMSAVVGIVGGLGVGATVHYYEQITTAFAQKGLESRILISHAEVGRIYDFAQRDDLEGMARYLSGHLDALTRGGAEVTTITAVLPHICSPELAKLGRSPTIDLIVEIQRAIAARRISSVAIFGSPIAMQSDLFGRLDGVTIIRPDAGDAAFLESTYRQLVQTGDPAVADVERVQEIGRKLVAQGAQCVLLAGTELALILDENNASFPVVDCASVHIKAIVERASVGSAD